MNVDGAQLIVDKKSFLYLNGSELDYGEELMSAGFKLVNPNVKRAAGAGSRSRYERQLNRSQQHMTQAQCHHVRGSRSRACFVRMCGAPLATELDYFAALGFPSA